MQMAEPSRKKAKLDIDNSRAANLTDSLAYTIHAPSLNEGITETLTIDIYENTVYFVLLDFTEKSLSKERILYRVSQAVKAAIKKKVIVSYPRSLKFGEPDSQHFRGGSHEELVQTVFSKTVLHLWDPAKVLDGWAPKCPTCGGTHNTGDGWATVVRQLIGDGTEDVWVHSKGSNCKSEYRRWRRLRV
jgi:hypothetical protein